MSGSQRDRSNGAGRYPGRTLVVLAIALLVFVPSASGGYGYTNPSVRSPIGPGTVPPSSYESGLVRIPNPMANTNNLLVTGNVGGGKHFRGGVPYDSVTSFAAPLGSTQFDSFLRYSAVPEGPGGYPRGYSEFYSPTGTVTTMPAGGSGVFAPTSPKVAGGLTPFRAERPADVMARAEVTQPEVTLGERRVAVDADAGQWQQLQTWPSFRTSEKMPGVIPDGFDERLSQPGNKLMTPQEYQRQLEQLQRDLDRVKTDASSLEQTLEVRSPAQPSQESPQTSLLQPPREPSQGPQDQPLYDVLPRDVDVPQRPVYATPDRAESPTSQQAPDTLGLPDLAPVSMQPMADGVGTDLSVETRWGLHDPPAGPVPSQPSSERDRIDAIFSPRTSSPSDADSVGRLPAVRRVEQTAHAYDAPGQFLERPLQNSAKGDAISLDRVASTLEQLRDASGSTEISPASGDEQAGAEPNSAASLIGDRFRRKYENAGSFSEERFERYTKAAQLYLQQGRYYRAADSFTLACMYKPGDSRAYLGKSQALLAAGEYAGSVLFLARAIELDPGRTLAKTNLVEILGGPDSFVRRITNLEEAAAASDAPQLQLLLAYIYHQMDRPQEARAAIEAAESKLPPSLPIDLLKATVGG